MESLKYNIMNLLPVIPTPLQSSAVTNEQIVFDNEGTFTGIKSIETKAKQSLDESKPIIQSTIQCIEQTNTFDKFNGRQQPTTVSSSVTITQNSAATNVETIAFDNEGVFKGVKSIETKAKPSIDETKVVLQSTVECLEGTTKLDKNIHKFDQAKNVTSMNGYPNSTATNEETTVFDNEGIFKGVTSIQTTAKRCMDESKPVIQSTIECLEGTKEFDKYTDNRIDTVSAPIVVQRSTTIKEEMNFYDNEGVFEGLKSIEANAKQFMDESRPIVQSSVECLESTNKYTKHVTTSDKL